MGTPSYSNWIIVLALIASWVIPLWFITKRIGRPPALSLLAVLVGPLYLWWLAFARWPKTEPH